MQYEQWQIAVTWTSGFTRDAGTGRIRYTLWFSAFDTDLTEGFQPHASAMLLSNVGYVAGHWQEYQHEIPIDQVRPGLAMLKRLGLPGGQLEGGGVSDGSETWDQLTVLIALDDGSRLTQCVLGGYDWHKTLPMPLREFLGQIVASLGDSESPARDIDSIHDMLIRNPR